MEFLKIEYLQYAISVVSILVLITTYIKGRIKNPKIRKKLKKIEDFGNQIIPIIVEAEALTNFSGKEKMEYALTKLNQMAIKSKIDFDQEVIEQKIEELIELSNKVNTNKTHTSGDDNAIKKIIENFKKG